MKLIYIASPYAGDVDKNIEFAKQACRFCIEQGAVPIAVHLLYPALLDDTVTAERATGMKLGHRVLEACDELWYCGDRVSRGMSLEIELAQKLNIPIRQISETEILSSAEQQTAGLQINM